VESYTKEEPVKEPVKEPCAAGAQSVLPDGFVDRFVAAYPRPGDRERTVAALEAAVADGADPDHILAGAEAYAIEQKGNAPRYIAYSDNWLRDRRWERFASVKASRQEVLKYWAGIVNGSGFVSRAAVGPSLASELVEAGLVTVARLRERGLS